MKRIAVIVVCLLISSVCLPVAVRASRPDVPAASAAPSTTAAATSAPPAAETTASSPVATDTSAASAAPEPRPMTVRILCDGVPVTMNAEDAVAAIVAAEMPALFPEAALRAQAVAARTYLAYRAAHPVSAHPDAVICDDPAHCCALADLDALAAGWGENGGAYAARVTSAAADTAGQILTYGGEPILAAFHAMSARATNSAADVWGGEVAYLRSIPAPAGESSLTGWSDSAVFDSDAFRALFLRLHPEADLPETGLDWFSDADTAESGLVRSIRVGGVTVTGGELRSMLGLRSAAFTVTQGTGRIRFDTLGYGHGVGMSQNGAKVLAQSGETYDAILAYYYPGCRLEAWE